MRRFVRILAVAVVLGGIVVSAAAALAFTDESYFVPEGVVGAPYTHKFEGRGGCDPPYVFTVLQGALPPGLTLRSDGVVTGTPTQAGTSSAWINLADDPSGKESWCTNPLSAQREFMFTMLARLLVTEQVPGPGTVGAPYSYQLVAVMKSGPDATSQPSSPVTWSVKEGTLPPGLVLGADGVISGTPTTAGSYTFTVLAVLDPTRSDTKQFKIDVKTALVAGPPKLPRGAEVGVRFSAALGATGGTGPGTYTWTLSGGVLPPGLVLAASGAITGTPRAAGAFPITATVADTEGRTATQPLAIVVAPRLEIATQQVRSAKVGRRYKAKVAARGGVLPKKWKIKRGKLPRGVRLNSALGLLIGTPREEGTFPFSVEVRDALGVRSTVRLTLVVNA